MDGRSEPACRFGGYAGRDRSELGGVDRLSEGQRQLVRRAFQARIGNRKPAAQQVDGFVAVASGRGEARAAPALAHVAFFLM